MFTQISRFRKLERALIFFACIIVGVNFIALARYYRTTVGRSIPRELLRPPGFEFNDFRGKLTGLTFVGFLTNKDMSPERNDGQFLAAQYVLAPVALDLDNSNHRFIIIDGTDLVEAFAMAQRVNAEPVYVNPFGKVLAEKGL